MPGVAGASAKRFAANVGEGAGDPKVEAIGKSHNMSEHGDLSLLLVQFLAQ